MSVVKVQGDGSGHGKRVVLASVDEELGRCVRERLAGTPWHLYVVRGGAEAIAYLQDHPQDALLLDHWLPDLDVDELEGLVRVLHPGMDILRMDGTAVGRGGSATHPGRSGGQLELAKAFRDAQAMVLGPPSASSALPAAPVTGVAVSPTKGPCLGSNDGITVPPAEVSGTGPSSGTAQPLTTGISRQENLISPGAISEGAIEGIIGQSKAMLELARLIRLVAPRTSTVLIEGETGTGKELVAQAVHRLSHRAHKTFAVLNCAAIPEDLLEAELFGHARGAFTGAVQARTGRIEAADGGTLFLDEIGEMPLQLQAKILRFLEYGELQRVGANEIVRVDVRVIAATHRQLEQRAAEGKFRLDLYHRLVVFPIEVPPLRKRKEDIPLLAEHFLARIAKGAGSKRLSAAALERLHWHDWPGNVRELAHVLERASILAGDGPVLEAEHIRLRGPHRTNPAL
jgi:DNA-binding NtrC family response regulator